MDVFASGLTPSVLHTNGQVERCLRKMAILRKPGGDVTVIVQKPPAYGPQVPGRRHSFLLLKRKAARGLSRTLGHRMSDQVSRRVC